MTRFTSTRAVRNTMVVFGGQVFARLLDLGATLLIARSFGEAAFGRFSFAVAYVGYFAILADLGFNMIFVQALVRERDRTRDLLTGMLIVKLVLIGLAMSLATGTILLSDYPPDTISLVRIMTFALLISPKFPSVRLVYEQVFQARLRMEIPVLLKLIDGVLLVALIYGVVRNDHSLQAVMIAYVLSSLPGLVILVRASRRFVIPSARFDAALMLRLFKHALPVALLGLFATLTGRIDVLFLSVWRGDAEVGLYAAAYRLTESFRMLPGAVMMSLYPLLAQASRQGAGTLAPLLASGLKPMLALMIPVCLGTTLFADRLIEVFYTSSYLPAGRSLAVLIWTELGFVLTMPMSYALIAIDRRRSVARMAFLMLLANLIMNAALIPRWGHPGAGMATVVTEWIGVLGYGITILRTTGWACWRLPLPLLPGAGCALAWMWVARSFPLPVVIPSSAVVYVLGLALTGGVRRGEIIALKNAVTGRRG